MTGPGQLARATSEGVVFEVRVQPRAKRTAVAGVIDLDGRLALRVALAAPPVDGKANALLIHFLSSALSVPRAAVVISAGARGRTKVVRVAGIEPADVDRLAALG